MSQTSPRPVKSAVALAVLVATLAAVAAPSMATAQSYDRGYRDEPRGAYDPCTREARQRGTAGGVAGALAGAAIGGNVAAKNARAEGAVLGAILGAVVGSQVGSGSAACGTGEDYDDRYGQDRYSQRGYPGSGSHGATGGYDRYGSGYGYDYDRDRSRGYNDDRYRYPERAAYDTRPAQTDGCRMADSPIHMPDGSVERRFVRVCPDAQGRYRVVD
ncbi:MAG: glycine zipper 2TM domain-containing protein [Asticcacaulis sp.]